ncbi:MAG: ABC transporter permease, partial [Xanthomonadaceae bacterium]|nr:ABC transporter permease [Xanthomonadaceae bacterium]
MFGYYIDLAWRSLRRTPILTALMVLAIALGIGASMTMMTVLHVMTQDPLPGRSAKLFRPYLDPLPLKFKTVAIAADPRDNLTWPDAMALLKAHRGVRQAAMAGGSLLVRPQRTDLQPFYVDGRYTTPDFFSMFGVPFVAGSGWTDAEETAQANVVVLAESLARKLFGSTDAVGRDVRLGDNDYRVVGVTGDWNPTPVFYTDLSDQKYSDGDKFFLPLSLAVQRKLQIDGNVSGWGKDGGS